jgi:hypothetical protein
VAVLSQGPSPTPLVVVVPGVDLVKGVPGGFVTVQVIDVAAGPDMPVENDTLGLPPDPTHPVTVATGVAISGHGLHSGTVKLLDPVRLHESEMPAFDPNCAVTATEYVPDEAKFTAPATAPFPLQPVARSVVSIGPPPTGVDLVACAPDCPASAGSVTSQLYPVGAGNGPPMAGQMIEA